MLRANISRESDQPFMELSLSTKLEMMNMQQSSIFLQPHPSGALAEVGERWAVLLLHGFTAGPSSVLSWGQVLAEAGATVSVPLLSGHGTSVKDLANTSAGRWREDAQRAFDSLRCAGFDRIAVGGLSMGGTLALDTTAHRTVDATFVVNPGLSFKVLDSIGVLFSPLLRYVLPTVGPLAGDINRPDVHEPAYHRTPTAAVEQLARLFRTVRGNLTRIQSPVTLYWSPQDHIVSPRTPRILKRGINPALLETRILENSYHAATLDYDAAVIHQDSIAKMLALSGGSHES